MNILVAFNRSLILTNLCLLFYSGLFAQKQEWKGYYIGLQADTVRGFFNNYKEWGNNPDKVSFTSVETGNRIQLTPSACRELHIKNGDTYFSYKGRRMTNPVTLDASTADNTDTFDEVAVFLRQVTATGPFKFYVYKDRRRINLYYSASGNAMVELLQKGAIINNSFWRSMVYKEQLKKLFPAESNSGDIDRLTYSEESLVAFVKTQGGTGGQSAGKTAHRSNDLFVLAGVSLNSFRFGGGQSPGINTSGYSSGRSPFAGVGYIVSLNRNFNRVFILPLVKVFSFEHASTLRYGNPYPAYSNTFQSSAVISVGLHAGYRVINKPGLTVSLMPGAGIAFLMNNRHIMENRFSATEKITLITPMDNLTYMTDMQALAIISKKFIVSAAYRLPTPVTNIVSVTGKLSSVQFGLGYKF